MLGDSPLILGLESSCDETAAAVVAGGSEVLSNVIATQHELHEEYAGVVPEIASRAHLERILPVMREAMRQAQVTYEDLDAIAVGNRPGLIGSLLVAVSAAKALAWSLNKPLIGIDHVQAHLYAGMLDEEPAAYPALGLVVSGGHTSLFLVNSPLDIKLLGKTIDDAIGEAYDKAAAILEIGYPGGPRIDLIAQAGDENSHDLPVSALDADSLNFSFSGLKTALLYAVRGKPVGRGADAHFERDASQLSKKDKANFAASFQKAAVAAVMLKLQRALKRHDVSTILVGGGVSANSLLRAELTELGDALQIDVRLPAMKHCLDNAAMIAGLAAERYRAGQFDDLTLSASPRTAMM
jgi:N6-L-threonylcarbamoyladenine synthase